MFHKLKYLFSALLFLLVLAGCKEDKADKTDPFESVANHTVLMYLIADHKAINPSLSSMIETNVLDAQRAVRDSLMAGSINLVIFKDNDKRGYSLPELYWVRLNKMHSLDTIPLKTFKEEVDACSPEVLKEVLKITFDKFSESKVKGLVIGGHAQGWMPSTNFHASSSTRSSQYVGIDCDTNDPNQPTSYFEFWDFADALRASNVHLNYLLMDCCNMGNIEVAYELRHLTDYLIAAPTEIQGDGFPYSTVITRLANSHSLETLPNALKESTYAYFDKYKRQLNASNISLYDMQHVDALGKAFFSLMANSTRRTEMMELMEQNNTSNITAWQRDFQQLGRSKVGTQYYFYDMGQFADYLNDGDSADSRAAADLLKQATMLALTTPSFFDISIKVNSGITISLPPCFALTTNNRKADFYAAYARTEWGKEMLKLLEYQLP